MNKVDRIREICEDNECECCLLDEFDDAITGYTMDVDLNVHVVYDRDLIIKLLVEFFSKDKKNKKRSMEDIVQMAVDYYDYNVERVLPHINENVRPVIVQRI